MMQPANPASSMEWQCAQTRQGISVASAPGVAAHVEFESRFEAKL
jgi:hypothetical protein